MTKEELFAIADNKHEFKISYYLDEGFKIFKKNIGGFIGIVVVNLLISFVLSSIPFIGSVLSTMISSFISAGMVFVCRKIRNGEETQFNDFFQVFKNPGPFIVLIIVQFLMIILVAIPAIGVFIAKYYDTFMSTGFASIEILLAMIPLMLFVLLPVLFLAMCYVFSVHIFLFLNQDFWIALEASRKVVMKNWLSMLGFLFVIGFLFLVVTVFTFGLGYFVMLPVSIATIYMAFEDIFKPSITTFEDKIEAFGTYQKDLNTEAEEKHI